jgi:hypothetical protein
MLISLLLACQGGSVSFGDGDQWALSYDGVGCASVPLDGQAWSSELTIEATVQGAENPTFATYPVLHWTDSLLLAELDDGRTWFGNPDTSTGGVIDVNGFMDGGIHHLAGTIDGDGRANLFVDGIKIGFADVDASGGDTLEIGCWSGDQDWSFQGTIDNVRISPSVRYTEDFDPPTTMEADLDTTAVWLFNEGEGLTFTDDARGYAGSMTEAVEWVPFDASE